MAIRLANALGTTPELGMNMQPQYDLWRARRGRQPTIPRFPVAALGLIAHGAVGMDTRALGAGPPQYPRVSNEGK
jgi:hypothetical protein